MPQIQDRAYLHRLEVEFGLDRELTRMAILAQGLFSAQICLIDQHLIDNGAVSQFFIDHEKQLLDSVKSLEGDELPLFGSCARGKDDCFASLDEMLAPRGGLPPRLASLSYEQYQHLSEGYSHLESKERQAKFLATKGAEGAKYFRYLEIATQYFKSQSNLTIVPQRQDPQNGLFQAMTSAVTFFQDIFGRKMDDPDKIICDALLKEMAKETSERKTRQRLHHALYGDAFPPYHDKRICWSAVNAKPDDVKDDWRYLVNAIYNRNLADSFGLASAQDFRAKRIRFEDEFQNNFNNTIEISKAGVAELECSPYPPVFSIEFVLRVRKQPQFWRSLRKADEIEHKQYIAQEFARYVTDDLERPDLVGKKKVDVIVIPLKKVRLFAPPIVGFIFFTATLPYGVALATTSGVAAYGATELLTNRICRGVEDYFATIGATTGQETVPEKKFLSFIDKVEEVAETTPPQQPKN